jgi:competence protein ComEC
MMRAALSGGCAFFAAFAVGATAAEVRVALVAAPRIASEIGPVAVEGWVEEIEAGAPRTRMLVRVKAIEGVREPSRFARITQPGTRAFTAGRAVRCRAMLRTPDGPLAPSAYDFARRAYFERIGATGFTRGSCRPIALAPPESAFDRARLRLAAVRSDMAEAIHAASPGAGGAVAASLLVGDRSFIEEAVNEDLRDSGLGHILSVSGLHMGVVGGLVFAALAGGFALIAPLALRVPVKKLAAVGALVVLTAYLLLSGSSVPALRAYVMACVAFGAILIDRPAISMRGLALAAAIIILVLPESALDAGFQMSFAATAALIAVFESWPKNPIEQRLPTPGPIVGALQTIGRGLTAALFISLVAGLATDPFALYHFQRFSVYGLPANLVAAPLVSFVIAPIAAIAALASLFGLAELPLKLLAAACDLLVGVGSAFADRPEAVRAMPKPPDAAFLVAVLAIVWACLWRGALRWGGAILFGVAILLYATAPKPALLFDGELRVVLAREARGWTLLPVHGRSTFARDRLGAMAGLEPARLEKMPPPACDEAACFIRLARGTRVAVVLSPEGFAAAGAQNAVVLTRLAAPSGVARQAYLVDRTDLARRGGGTITETRAGLRVARARGHETRPWRN